MNHKDAANNDRKILGERLREAREYIGFSQAEIAARLGTSRSALSLMEAGQRKVEVFELKKMATFYGRPIEFFTGELEISPNIDQDVAHLARQVSELEPEDRNELARFAEFLRSRKPLKGE